MSSPVHRCDIELHIGLEKTGTTAIQAYLGSNRHVLIAEHGILFPRSLGGRLSANLAAACQLTERLDDLRKIRGLLTPDAVDAYRAQLAEAFALELAHERPTRLVITCEHLSSRLHQQAELARLRDFLLPHARSLRVWVYLRRQDAFLVSAYSTAVRSGRSAPFRWPKAGTERRDLHFDRLLDRWAGVFGEAAVRPRIYDRRHLLGGDIVSDFCAALDLPPGLERSTAEANTSLNARLLEFLREFNDRVPRFIEDRVNPRRGDIGIALAGADVPGDRLDAMPGAAAFYARFAAGNQAVAQRWFADSDRVPADLFDPPPPERAAGDAPPLDSDELLDVCAQLWGHAQEKLAAERALSSTLMAELAIERNLFERAEQLLAEVQRLHPDFARAWAARALLDQGRGDHDGARSHIERALVLAPNDTEVREIARRLG